VGKGKVLYLFGAVDCPDSIGAWTIARSPDKSGRSANLLQNAKHSLPMKTEIRSTRSLTYGLRMLPFSCTIYLASDE